LKTTKDQNQIFYLLFEVRSLAFIQRELSIIVVTIREIDCYLAEDNYSSKQLKRIFFYLTTKNLVLLVVLYSI